MDSTISLVVRGFPFSEATRHILVSFFNGSIKNKKFKISKVPDDNNRREIQMVTH